MYYVGKGVVQDYKQAVKWCAKAAEQGNAKAQGSLGAMYYLGEGVVRDYKQAVKWLTKAAEQGNATAQLHLGICYSRGKGVVQDYIEAVKWCAKAVEQGNARAQHNLGIYYIEGKGVTRDYKEALKWFKKAEQQGHQGARGIIIGLTKFREQPQEILLFKDHNKDRLASLSLCCSLTVALAVTMFCLHRLSNKLMKSTLNSEDEAGSENE
jgi:TPR repeat protein